MILPPSKILIALPQTGTQIFGKYIVVRFHSAESPGVLDSADFLLQLSKPTCSNAFQELNSLLHWKNHTFH